MHDWGKMALLGLAMICVTVLRGLNALSATESALLLGMIVGYLTGNGVNALRGRRPEPVLAPRSGGAPDPGPDSDG